MNEGTGSYWMRDPIEKKKIRKSAVKRMVCSLILGASGNYKVRGVPRPQENGGGPLLMKRTRGHYQTVKGTRSILEGGKS